jgi:hypothetical protein
MHEAAIECTVTGIIECTVTGIGVTGIASPELLSPELLSPELSASPKFHRNSSPEFPGCMPDKRPVA